MKKNKLLVGIVAIFSLVLVACGRDVSTVENAIEGHWTMTDARLNDRPLEEAIEEYDELFDANSESTTEAEEGQADLDVDLYRDGEVLTLVNADGEQTRLPYEVISSDEENNTLTLEYNLEEEDMDLRLNEVVEFLDEERESITSSVNIVDMTMKNQADTEEASSELEQELEQFGEELATEFLRSMNFEFDQQYVDDAEAPQEQNENAE